MCKKVRLESRSEITQCGVNSHGMAAVVSFPVTEMKKLDFKIKLVFSRSGCKQCEDAKNTGNVYSACREIFNTFYVEDE